MKKSSRLRTLFAAIAAASLIPATAVAATDQYLKIDTIAGESTSETHPNEIEIQAWSWGMDRPSTGTATTLAMSLGRPCVSELSMTKFVDKASPKLMGALVGGTVLAKVKLSITQAGGLAAPVDFFTIDMTSVYVTSLQESGSSGGDRPIESFALKFAAATVTYTPISQLGKPGTPVPVILKTPPC